MKKTMDTINLELITQWYPDEKKSDIYIGLVLNGELITAPFDPYEFIVSSLYKRVQCEILTCSCGVAGCAGIFHGTYVKHRRHTVEWRDIDCGLPKRFYSFDKNKYNKTVEEVKFLMEKVAQYRQDYIKDDYYYGPVEFENVEQCKKSIERVLKWHSTRRRELEVLPHWRAAQF